MKCYTVKEFAKKIKMSESFVYSLIKNGTIKKRDSLGVVRIPSGELNKVLKKDRTILYNPKKVEVLKTHLGDIRKVIAKDEYVASDISNALMLKDSYSIVRRLDTKLFKKIELEEVKNLGVTIRCFGLILISYEGLVEYCSKSRNIHNLDMDKFLEELKVVDEIPIDEVVEEKEVKSNRLKIFEGQEVEIIEVNGEILFELYSTGMALGYVKSDGKSMTVHGGQKLFPRKDRINKIIENGSISICSHGVNKYLSEENLYDFMLEAKAEKCKSFRKWVTNEILPTIRKTGGYVNKGREEQFINNYFSSFSEETRKTMLKDLVKSNKELQEKLNSNKKLILKIEESF